jgi:hypothetical protein
MKKTDPQVSPGEAQSRPPQFSMIERHILRPIPMPSDFVVKKASKIRSRFSGSIPVPVSFIDIKTLADLSTGMSR